MLNFKMINLDKVSMSSVRSRDLMSHEYSVIYL